MCSVKNALNSPETASDYQAAMELSKRLDELNEESDRLFAQWAELSEAIETAKKETI